MFTFEDKNYVNTPEKLLALDDYLMFGDEPKFNLIAFDTETNGTIFYKNVVIGFSISVSRHEGYYIPLLEWVPDPASEKERSIEKVKQMVFTDGQFRCAWTGQMYPEFVTPKDYRPPEFVTAFLRRWLTHPEVRLIMHNAPFDVPMTLFSFDTDLTDNLWLDVMLLKHVLDENTELALKMIATFWKKELGFSPDQDAKAEMKELGTTIVRNGGKFNSKTKHVWRGNPYQVAKYGAADTCLTFGVAEVGLQKFEAQFTPEHLDWFFEKEVMPLCREVVIPMKIGGVYIDVPYFEKLQAETQVALDRLEDEIQKVISPHIQDFDIGLSMDEAVSKGRLMDRIIELEKLAYPTITQKGVVKESLSKKAVQTAYQENPHWLWGYILGENEIKYSDEKLLEIKHKLYQEVLERRYRFNIRSADHLRWLFCGKLGYDERKLPQTDSATADNPIPSMAAEVLQEHFLKDHPWVKLLLRYAKLNKLQGTYIEAALENHNNGWLHMDMKQAGTISGRFSCSGGFNLQTLPKVEELDKCPKCESKKIKIVKPIALLANLTCEACGHQEDDIVCPSAIKAGFVAPPGYKIINADYQALEPRCFGFCSGEDKLKEVFWNGLDIYSKVYIDMLDKEGRYSAKEGDENFLKKKNKKARDLFKPVVLGIPYGARAPQVANLMDLKIEKTFKNRETGESETKMVLDVQQGEFYRNLYLQTYPNLHQYMLDREAEAVGQGYVQTLIGRRRHFEYAPFIYALIGHYGVTVDEFLDARWNEMEQENAMNGVLKKEGLLLFCEEFKYEYWKLAENGFWNYLRNLFKNEYNNAKNFPIQGLAAHITNKGMLDTARSFRKNGIDGYVCLQVHDEITSYARIDQAEEAATYQKVGMEDNEFAKRLDICMVADPIICDNLKDSK